MTVLDILSLTSTICAIPLGVFCFILSRRLKKLNDLEQGLGGAIAVMAAEVTRLESAIHSARAQSQKSADQANLSFQHSEKAKAHWMMQSYAENGPMNASRQIRRLRKREQPAIGLAE